ncbi:hypothetical protein [Clostridium sp. AWRP]|uniref:hypothetical protein n=1 Tax=Clostridium sp. AWRP TaxID=2212991 RepID=UPI000FD9AB60|nr:hypothetical protein [Clostridium sp. AWRP]AZV58382.1 hypothetical protein DMR38_18305 [Clostridium sp. AWRP]
MSKYVLKVEKIGVDKPRNFGVPYGTEVTVNHFHFMENQISRIEVKKIEDCQDTIFINLYSGNMRIGHVVAKGKDYVLDIDTIGKLQRYYDIRPAAEFDKEG